MNHGSIEFCHLKLCLCIEVCKQFNICGSLLFVDIVCAFANLIRVFVLEHESIFDSDGSLRDHLLKLQLSLNEIQEFFELAVKFSVWAEKDLSHLHKCIASMHQYSWFSLENLEGVFECGKGTLAGTALADLLFCFLMIKVLSAIRRQLEQDDLVFKIPTEYIKCPMVDECDIMPNDTKYYDVSYVDDCMMPVF